MTHSIQTIATENQNLAQQKKNHGYLRDTLNVDFHLIVDWQELVDLISIDTEKQAVLANLEMFLKNVLLWIADY